MQEAAALRQRLTSLSARLAEVEEDRRAELAPELRAAREDVAALRSQVAGEGAKAAAARQEASDLSAQLEAVRAGRGGGTNELPPGGASALLAGLDRSSMQLWPSCSTAAAPCRAPLAKHPSVARISCALSCCWRWRACGRRWMRSETPARVRSRRPARRGRRPTRRWRRCARCERRRPRWPPSCGRRRWPRRRRSRHAGAGS